MRANTLQSDDFLSTQSVDQSVSQSGASGACGCPPAPRSVRVAAHTVVGVGVGSPAPDGRAVEAGHQ
jgi:hypothetical protein